MARVSRHVGAAFPGAELVGAAADLLPAIREAGGNNITLGEGPRWEVVVSPDVIRVRTRYYAGLGARYPCTGRLRHYFLTCRGLHSHTLAALLAVVKAEQPSATPLSYLTVTVGSLPVALKILLFQWTCVMLLPISHSPSPCRRRRLPVIAGCVSRRRWPLVWRLLATSLAPFIAARPRRTHWPQRPFNT